MRCCSLFPAANNYYLSIEALTADNIHFFTARRGDVIVGVNFGRSRHLRRAEVDVR
jgi:hypothetical protein